MPSEEIDGVPVWFEGHGRATSAIAREKRI
jgi:hypothetical protein